MRSKLKGPKPWWNAKKRLAKILALSSIILITADGIMTWLVVSHFGWLELNPFVAQIAVAWWFPVFKSITGIIGIGIVLRIYCSDRRALRVIAGAGLIAITILYVAVVSFNLSGLLRSII